MLPFLPELLLRVLRAANTLAEYAATLEQNDSKLQTLKKPPPEIVAENKRLTASLKAHMLEALSVMEEYANDTGLDATVIASGQLAKRLKDDSLNSAEMKARVEELRDIIVTELGRHTFFRVLQQNKQYLTNDKLFGERAWDAFPSARKDIREAGMCLAMQRGTATVFHLMRAMEHALRAIARPLGIPYAPSWETYLSQMNAKISAKHSSKAPPWKKIQPLFIELLGDLQAVKIAWRNPTMHIHRHYSPEEAEEVFRTVKRFIARVSEQFAEPVKKPSARAPSAPSA